MANGHADHHMGGSLQGSPMSCDPHLIQEHMASVSGSNKILDASDDLYE